MSWLKDIGDKMYTEGWGPSSPLLPGDAQMKYTPKETASSVRMKGIFGAGDTPSNPLAMSQASGHNPFEQEEVEIINKPQALHFIDKELNKLNPNNQLDQSAILALSKLKEIFEKL